MDVSKFSWKAGDDEGESSSQEASGGRGFAGRGGGRGRGGGGRGAAVAAQEAMKWLRPRTMDEGLACER